PTLHALDRHVGFPGPPVEQEGHGHDISRLCQARSGLYREGIIGEAGMGHGQVLGQQDAWMRATAGGTKQQHFHRAVENAHFASFEYRVHRMSSATTSVSRPLPATMLARLSRKFCSL